MALLNTTLILILAIFVSYYISTNDSNLTTKVTFMFFDLLGMNPTKWHVGKEWKYFLDMYDERVEKNFNHCTSRLIPTSFGKTHVLDCNPDSNLPVVLFFHGARDTATSWKYQVQSTEMQSKFHMIAVDYICDAGRSLPIKCPSEKGDHGKWVEDLMAYLKIENADLVGYSYGSFVSASVGIEAPDLVKGRNIILNAPAAVVTPVRVGFWYHVLMPAIFQNTMGFDLKWYMDYVTSPNYDLENEHLQSALKYQLAMMDVSYEYDLGILPYSFSDKELQQLSSAANVVLIMPELETVTDPKVGVDRAKSNGIKTVVIEDCGHGMQLEKEVEMGNAIARILF